MIEHPFIEGNMTTSDLLCANLQFISERGLSSFLQAIAEIVPDIDLSDASDCWMRAVESTDWVTGMSAERFIRQVAMNALASSARHGLPIPERCFLSQMAVTRPIH